MKKKSLLLVLFLLMVLTGQCAYAYDFEVDGIYYNYLYSDGSYHFAAVAQNEDNRYSGNITIPSSVSYDSKVYRIIEIDENAFMFCTGLTNITIPNSVTNLDDGSFYGCSGLNTISIPNSVTNIGFSAFERSGLTSIVIPNSVTSIGISAFSGCSYLTSISISNSVVNIGRQAFEGCYSLNSIIVDSENPKYDSHDNCNAIIETSAKKLIQGCYSTSIPSSVTSIGDYAFSGCSNMSSITIPNSVTNIGNNAFSGCSGLTSIEIPNSVTSIGQYAFSSCSSLTSITIPNSVTSIGREAFSGSGVSSIIIPINVTSISSGMCYECTNLTSVTIPCNVSSIERWAFGGCSSLATVTSKIKTPFTFGDYAFDEISNTCKLIVPYGTTDAYIAAGWTTSVFKGGIEEADPTELPVTISDAGVATFCSNFDLDFTSSEVKAYIVSTFTPSTGSVTLTRVMDVPAGEGLILKGAAGTYDIPVCTGETVMANMLVGVTTATQLNKVDGDYTNYILARNGASWGFFAVADGSTLAAGKAYLPLPTAKLPSSNVKSLNIVFDDEPVTAVEDIEGVSKEDAQIYYNLNGQRVEKPTRGLYIVGGKKVFVK